MRLTEFVRWKATNQIEIKDAKLLLECMGRFLDNLFPGGIDLRHVKMPNEVKDYFPSIRREFRGEKVSLHSFPEVALGLLLSLKLRKDDGFLLDVFVLVLVKDLSMSHNSVKDID